MSMLFGQRPGAPIHQMDCLGVTEQLIGEPWLHAEPFVYCGNIGPVELPDAVRDGMVGYATQIAEECELRGVWGLDFVFDDTTAFPVEVNPRYTASAEVIELAKHTSFLSDHARDFVAVVPPQRAGGSRSHDVVGKAIYFAPHAIRFPDEGLWDLDLLEPFRVWRVPGFADIPDAGVVIESGHPVLTIFATADTPVDVRDGLQSRAAELDTLFAEHAP
jgi:predicted ATP-grasp superfamily ATP-dependent carboligase